MQPLQYDLRCANAKFLPNTRVPCNIHVAITMRFAAPRAHPCTMQPLQSDSHPRVTEYCDLMYCDLMYCDPEYCDMMYCDVIVMYCYVMYCDVMYCDVMYCYVMYCDVMYCDVM